MRVHHLNCISTCPLGGALMDGHSAHLRGRLTCHCLLVESPSGLVLVDTGFGVGDCRSPRPRLARFFLALLEPELREEMTAIRQIQALGFDPRDVRHIVLTHLDFDHAGGLDDFPWATVHLLAQEAERATRRKTTLDRLRYRPQQWGDAPKRWKVYRAGEGEAWYGFDCVRDLDGIDAPILLVPLIGHTVGHAGVAVEEEGRWLLQAGDAYFYWKEMNLSRPQCTPGLAFYQWFMQQNRKARRWNQQRLRALKAAHSAEVVVFSAHDTVEFEALSGRSSRVPALLEERYPLVETAARDLLPAWPGTELE